MTRQIAKGPKKRLRADTSRQPVHPRTSSNHSLLRGSKPGGFLSQSLPAPLLDTRIARVASLEAAFELESIRRAGSPQA
jgi:hypothetical protein